MKGIKKDSSGAWLVCDLTADGNDVVTSTCVSMATFSLTGVSLGDLLFFELYLKGDEGNTLWKWDLNDNEVELFVHQTLTLVSNVHNPASPEFSGQLSTNWLTNGVTYGSGLSIGEALNVRVNLGSTTRDDLFEPRAEAAS